MGVQQCKTAVLTYEVHLLEPQAWRFLAQHGCKRVILSQRVRKLDEPAQLERPDAHGSARDRLVRVRIEKGAVVLDLERLHPLWMAQREGGTKAGGSELPQVVVDSPHALAKLRLRCEVATVVLEPMHAHLEAACLELHDQTVVNSIAFGDEVERRTEAVHGVEVRHSKDVGLAFRRLDIVREHKGIRPAFRPKVDKRQGVRPDRVEQVRDDRSLESDVGLFHRPSQLVGGSAARAVEAARMARHSPGQYRLDHVIKAFGRVEPPMPWAELPFTKRQSQEGGGAA